MDEFYSQIMSSSYTKRRKRLWNYQYILGRDFIVNYLNTNGYLIKGLDICEIGAAEGGVAQSLVLAGANFALCTDILPHRLEIGKEMAQKAHLNMQYTTHDIIYDSVLPEWEEKFDVVILRDVIEHLDSAETAIKQIKKIIKPGGVLYITFPPYSSPYGGHQQILGGKFLTRLPYIHLIPKKLFLKLIKGLIPDGINEVTRLSKIRLSSQEIINVAKSCNYDIIGEDYFLLRPVFKAKYNLPTIKTTKISFLPGFRGLFALEASFLLKKNKE